jgi:hypothetical protein
MPRHRPLGVKLIAAYLCLRASALSLAVTFAHLRPELRPVANEFISNLVPFIKRFDPTLGVALAPLFALLDVVTGVGVWFLQKWARTIVFLNASYAVWRVVIGLAVLMAFDRKMLSSITWSPYFLFWIASNAVMFGYFYDPGVKRIFGEKD